MGSRYSWNGKLHLSMDLPRIAFHTGKMLGLDLNSMTIIAYRDRSRIKPVGDRRISKNMLLNVWGANKQPQCQAQVRSLELLNQELGMSIQTDYAHN
jgi:hypothetical protein